MKIINRKMESNAITTDESHLICQASFNSDGVITLRNYNFQDRNSDEIIILSERETKAIFNLFSKIGSINTKFDLPF